MNEKFRKVLLYVCITILSISIAYIAYYKYTMYTQKQGFEELQELKSEEIASTNNMLENSITDSSNIEKKEQAQDETQKKILKEYHKLYQQNTDLYGWITIKNTPIDYPVMYTPEEPNYYLYKNWEKEKSTLGSIFIDGRTNENTGNIIIYGHNMKNETMFGSLYRYKEREYYETHKYIEFDTIYEKATYEIIAVASAIVYYEEEPPEGEYLFYEHIDFNSEEEFDEYISAIRKNSYYEINTSAKYGEQIITLCTCDYWKENARLLIVAKKLE